MQTVRLVVFDVAGTIIEDHGEVADSFQQALKQNGIAIPDGQLMEWRGASKREVIRHFVEEQFGTACDRSELIEQTYAEFRALLESRYRQGITPVAGADATFKWLVERKTKIATTTGFYREINDLILDQTGWRGMIDAVVSSSDVRQGRPAPFMIFHAMEATGVTKVGEVMNVGDTPLDLQSGSNGGVGFVVGVLSGAMPRAQLEREPHTHLVESVADIPDLINNLSPLSTQLG
jgi:phosphonatase-like hydrolase